MIRSLDLLSLEQFYNVFLNRQILSISSTLFQKSQNDGGRKKKSHTQPCGFSKEMIQSRLKGRLIGRFVPFTMVGIDYLLRFGHFAGFVD